ncbi:hypothetical protein NA78x_001338 [Anatilimnocola sp. NA78]|uniref:hypothetical protein n=1 Tax=Anatilimnocola sp. NA78 TaxID=3415683 RepID=UPI003CE557A2
MPAMALGAAACGVVAAIAIAIVRRRSYVAGYESRSLEYLLPRHLAFAVVAGIVAVPAAVLVFVPFTFLAMIVTAIFEPLAIVPIWAGSALFCGFIIGAMQMTLERQMERRAWQIMAMQAASNSLE